MQHADIVIQDREELFFLLCEAAEFEHSVMCSYLYAMWSLKRDVGEGVIADELAAIERWRRSLRQVALEEMLHLSLVNNLLTATGSAPHLWRPPFPVESERFPANVVMRLTPFSRRALDHFLYLERPEGVVMVDGAGFDHPDHHRRPERPDLLSPTPRDYDSQGQLYHAILGGLASLTEAIGEANVFVGHGEAQVGRSEIGLPGLFDISDLASARRAIDEIVSQGEGAPAHRDGSHFQRFAAIRNELAALQRARPAFEPGRPAVENPSLDADRAAPEMTGIADPVTAKVVDLGNAIYALMMRTFAQVFSPAPLPRGLRVELAAAATDLMYAVTMVGEAATTLPAGGSAAGATGGLTFALPMSSGQLVQRCAAQILGERARELAAAAAALATSAPLEGLAGRLDGLAHRFTGLHERFETHIAAAVEGVASAAAPPPAPPPQPAPESGDDPNVARTPELTLRFDPTRCIHSRRCVLGAPSVFLANVKGPWLHPETVSVGRCTEIAHACPSGAITYERHDDGPQESAPPVNVLTVRENGPYAVRAQMVIEGRGALFRATLCRCGKSANKPFCDNSHRGVAFVATGEPETIESEPLPVRNGLLEITPLEDGPLQVVGPLEICSGTGRTVNRVENARLCRCGGSATKPFCDGTHARIGFRSEAPAVAGPDVRPLT
ncbi:MAG TPA: ferritin-like domain-containing protein [Caulobacteraceae bacterium]|nr:ferritin-like domain-containing protein [Caulobacteraceae bacterium]